MIKMVQNFTDSMVARLSCLEMVIIDDSVYLLHSHPPIIIIFSWTHPHVTNSHLFACPPPPLPPHPHPKL